jgi:hypothetical protein
VGIVNINYEEFVSAALMVVLGNEAKIDRLPYPDWTEFHGIKLPQLYLNAFDASTPLKVDIAVKACKDSSLVVGFNRV